VTGGDSAAALNSETIPTIAARVIAPAYITLSLPCGEQKRQNPALMKYWEIVADNLSKAGWS
jgi:hypothetical protein